MPAIDARSSALSGQANESTFRTSAALVTGSNDSAATHKLNDAMPSEEKFRESAQSSEHFAPVRSADSVSSAATESKPPLEPKLNSERNVPAALIAPVSPAPRKMTPAMAAAPHLPASSAILVTLPSRGSQPFRVSFSEKTIAATSSFAMTSQLSVLVPPKFGPTTAHRPARLQAGELVSFVWPRYPKFGGRYGLAETIRIRATIGQLGQVRDVKFLSGSSSLLPATKAAIRQWRYTPTLLDKRPVQAQQDVTIEFRPQQYSSQLSTQHPSHN